MRQGQQNRRGRGRNRKGQNPLTRSFESNGPDVKIRGTPAHVAEKYMSLARDAMASGDRVLAENYFQHAEHYNRIIMSYRDQQTGADNNQGSGRSRGQADDQQGLDDESGMDLAGDDVPGLEPQPQLRGPDKSTSGESSGAERQRPGGRQARGGARRARGANGSSRNGASSNGASAEPNGSGNGNASAGRRRREAAPAFAEDGGDQPQFLRRSVRPSTQSEDAGEASGAED